MPEKHFAYLLENWFDHIVLASPYDDTSDLVVLSWYGPSPYRLLGWRVLDRDELDDVVASVVLTRALGELETMPVDLGVFITNALAHPPFGYRR